MNRRAGLILAGMVVLTALAIAGLLNEPPSPPYVPAPFSWGYTVFDIAIVVGIAWVYIGAGLVADRRRPDSRIGLLMIAVGGALLIEGLQYLPIPAIVTFAVWLDWGVAGVLLGTVVLTYPSGRAGSRLVRAWIGIAGAFIVLSFANALVVPFASAQCAPGCRPLVTLAFDEAIRWEVEGWLAVAYSVLSAMLLVVVIHRWLSATPAARRSLLPVTVAGLILGVVVVLSEVFWRLVFGPPAVIRTVDPSLIGLTPAMAQVLEILHWLSLVAFPLALLWGLLRTQLGQAAVAELALRLQTEATAAEPGRLRDAVSRALGDPTLEVALWSRQAASWIDEAGRPAQPGLDDPRRAVTRLDAPDGPVAVLVHDPAVNDRPGLVAAVTAVAQLAIENERLHAEVKAQLTEVRASRERIVRATDDERRRVERDIHDGAQQRLVSLSLALGLAQAQASDGSPELATTLSGADAELRAAIDELRALARGIHPAILTEAGLGPALESLADHAPLPVAVTTQLNGRLSAVVEATAYFVASEALTNVAKHAGATAARLHAAVVDDSLHIEISDNGRGGADPLVGTGLRGLLDRVTALGGRLSIEPVSTGGTLVTAEIPCA